MTDSRSPVTIYTDGGSKPNPGPGGWGALLIAADGRTREISGADPDTTNNRMELTAAVEALRALKQSCDVAFYTDSNYLKNGITKWLRGWIARGWRRKDDQPVLNVDLWRALHAETQRHRITWHWVKGHAGDEHNERVDQLATAAREKLTGGQAAPDATPATDGPAPKSPPVHEPAHEPEYEIALRVSVPRSGGPGGYAFRAARRADQDMGTLHTGRAASTNSSALILVAARDALRTLPAGAVVRVWCPDEYLFRGMTEWIDGWRRRGWRTSSKKPVKNRDLWEALLAEAERRAVQWTLEDDAPPLAQDLSQSAADAAG